MPFFRHIALPDYVSIEKRPVKVARVKISPKGEVQIILPNWLPKKYAAQLYSQKRQWIEKKRKEAQKPRPVFKEVGVEEMLLWGDIFDTKYADQDIEHIDKNNKIVYAKILSFDIEFLKKLYMQIAKKYLVKRTAYLADAQGFSYCRLTIRGQKTRWGSCSSKGNISLNYKLLKMPPVVSDYIILHELAHTRYLNHSPDFWSLVGHICPEYKEHKTWLKRYGHGL